MLKIKPIFITGLCMTIVMASGEVLILFIDHYSQDKSHNYIYFIFIIWTGL